MKALVYTGPHALALHDLPVPSPVPGEALIRVEAVGICGSDMHAYHGHDSRRPAPLVLGHEAAGRIVGGPRDGRRVTINPLVTCGTCVACTAGRSHLCPDRQILSMPPRAGAFAEYVCAPESNLVEIPEDLPIVKAALAEPLAVSYHAVNLGARLLCRPLSGADCAVLGGGAIGLGAALVLAMQGARTVSLAEPNPERRATIARAASGVRCYGPDEVGRPVEGSADLIVDAVGSRATRAAASRLTRPGGVIVHVGLLPGDEGLDIRKLTLQEIVVSGSYCYTGQEFRDIVGIIAAGRLGALDWAEERALADGVAAFAAIDANTTASPKIVLRPHGAP
ncbi:alcohol dehydrogenase catalytic domain-containing protein [Methylobacterium nigriterrae]|uniref:alcohol dehydrogenase catalytic domain-containing protein n=1 Tax=Methylobacterium nigriterrae TaxID=3127512 RepID=UPI003013A3A9